MKAKDKTRFCDARVRQKATVVQAKKGEASAQAGAPELTPAQLRGQRRSQKVAARILEAVALIRREIAANKGVYPGGEVSYAEIARRAVVHPGTYYTPAQKDKEAHLAAKALVDEFGTPNEEQTEKPKKKSLQDRLIDSQLAFDGLATSHDLTELHLQEAEAQRDKAFEERDEALAERDAAIKEKHALQAKVEDLLQRLAIAESKNVRPLRPK